MAKIRIYEIDQRERNRMLDEFFEMVSKMKTKKDVSNFFKDMLTPSESLILTRRIEIAKLLLAGFSYVEIKKKLRAGDNTINYVNRWLFSGFGGYLKELQGSENMKEAKKQLPTNEWATIKKKYPAHFLIFNMVDKFKKRKK